MRFTKRALWLVGAWVGATLAAAAVALAVVGLAGEQVADGGIQPLSARDVEALGVPAPTAVSTSAVTGATSSTAGTVSTTVADTPTTTTTSATPVTTAAPAVTPTTVPPESSQVDSRQVTGGTVVVRWTSSSVQLVSASPTDGFHVDVEKRGPDQVTVEFEGNGVKSKYSAEVSDGRLVVETGVEAEGD